MKCNATGCVDGKRPFNNGTQVVTTWVTCAQCGGTGEMFPAPKRPAEVPETEDFSAGVAMMSAAMTSPEARETLRLSFFAAALTGSAQINTKDSAGEIAQDALRIANAAVEVWYGRDKK